MLIDRVIKWISPIALACYAAHRPDQTAAEEFNCENFVETLGHP